MQINLFPSDKWVSFCLPPIPLVKGWISYRMVYPFLFRFMTFWTPSLEQQYASHTDCTSHMLGMREARIWNERKPRFTWQRRWKRESFHAGGHKQSVRIKISGWQLNRSSKKCSLGGRVPVWRRDDRKERDSAKKGCDSAMIFGHVKWNKVTKNPEHGQKWRMKMSQCFRWSWTRGWSSSLARRGIRWNCSCVNNDDEELVFQGNLLMASSPTLFFPFLPSKISSIGWRSRMKVVITRKRFDWLWKGNGEVISGQLVKESRRFSFYSHSPSNGEERDDDGDDYGGMRIHLL